MATKRFPLPTSEWEVGDPAEQALLSGTLRLDRRNCLVVAGYPVWWPKDFSATIDTDMVIRVFDGDGTEVARTDSAISAGGGYGRPVEKRPCNGPYREVFVMQDTPSAGSP